MPNPDSAGAAAPTTPPEKPAAVVAATPPEDSKKVVTTVSKARPVGPVAIVLMTVYLMALALGLLGAIYVKWPRNLTPTDQPAVVTNGTQSATTPAGQAATGTDSVGQDTTKPKVAPGPTSESKQKPEKPEKSKEPAQPDVAMTLLLLVPLVGALGATIHSLRSFYAYVGEGQLAWRWVVKYLMMPFVGAALAEVFYLVIRGGFFSPTADASSISPWGICAVSALVGLFTGNALNRLGKVADAIFDKATTYSDPLKSQPAAPADQKPPDQAPATDSEHKD
jgi:hypothetical protein